MTADLLLLANAAFSAGLGLVSIFAQRPLAAIMLLSHFSKIVWAEAVSLPIGKVFGVLFGLFTAHTLKL